MARTRTTTRSSGLYPNPILPSQRLRSQLPWETELEDDTASDTSDSMDDIEVMDDSNSSTYDISDDDECLIDRLPDDPLCNILSFLQIITAVRTSILSRRWRFLSRNTTFRNLDFDDGLNPERQASFVNLVDKMVNPKNVLNIERFSLRCGEYCRDLVMKWISVAVMGKVKKILLNLSMEQPIMTPHTLFTSGTLVVLKFFSGIVVDIPASVCLPCLKVLHLQLVKYVIDGGKTIQNLLKGSPIIEELHILGWNTQSCLVISNRTLRSLTIEFDYEVTGNRLEEDDQYILVVNTPYLEYFSLEDYGYHTDRYLIQSMSFIDEAFINVGQWIDYSAAQGFPYRVLGLLQRFSNVSYLTLSDYTLYFLSDYSEFVLPKFEDLIYLELQGDMGWEILMKFLERSPFLEVLILNQGSERRRFFYHDWRPPLHLPVSLVSKLEEIKIEYNLVGIRERREEITFLLENAKVLGILTINDVEIDMEEESCLCTTLSTFEINPRICQICQNVDASRR